MSDTCEPTPLAPSQRMAAVRTSDHARPPNHLDGAVPRLSPYLTRGFLHVSDAMRKLPADIRAGRTGGGSVTAASRRTDGEHGCRTPPRSQSGSAQ